MLKSLNSNNFYTDEIRQADISNLAYKPHNPIIYNANSLKVCADVRFCIKSFIAVKANDEYEYYTEMVEEIYPNIKELPEKPFARKTTVVSVKKERVNEYERR